MTSFRSFLTKARKSLATASSSSCHEPLTFVIGNEAADLDSLCSALLLAYFQSQRPRRRLHIPICNLPRADLALRPELDAVLRHVNLTPADLITLSDLPPLQDLDPARTRWLLVDHNALTGEVGRRFASRVVGCIDHHDEESRVPADCGDEPRIIRKCGSCMSLVIEYCHDIWQALAPATDVNDNSNKTLPDAPPTPAWALAAARVAAAPILIDTVNLTSKEKTTDTDLRSLDFIEEHGAAHDPTYMRARYWQEIVRLEEDISRMSYRDILRKDYKQWTENGLTLGISSVPQGLEYMLERIGDVTKMMTALRKWAEDKGLEIAVVMTTLRPDGKFARELLVWALSERAIEAAKHLPRENRNELGLERWGQGKLDGGDGISEWRRVWKQNEIKHSRKQLGPMIRRAMKQ